MTNLDKISELKTFLPNPSFTPAILTNDNIFFEKQVAGLLADFDKIDIDFMDGSMTSGSTIDIEDALEIFNTYHFDNNLNFRKKIGIHLMVENYELYLLPHIIKQIDEMVIHYESIKKTPTPILKYLKNIREFNPKIKIGIASTIERELEFISTYKSNLSEIFNSFDFIQLMTVKLGSQNGNFVREALNVIHAFETTSKLEIKIDGGINPMFLKSCNDNDLAILNNVNEISIGSYFICQ